MATIEASTTSFGGNTFWGLVQQKGPWQSTSFDKKRATESKPNYAGGGVGAGGTAHAGNGNWLQVMTPNQLNGSAAPLEPSGYAMRSVMMKPVDMKKQTKISRVKSKLTLASRTPFQTGAKMGLSPEEIRFDQPGQPKGQSPLFQEGNFISEIKKETPYLYIPPSPSVDQRRASEISRDDERKQVMSARSEQPLQVDQVRLEKRPGSFQLGPAKSKRQQKGFGEVGFKRKAMEKKGGKKKKTRALFQGPLNPEPLNVSTKRKAEKQLMSQKFKKMDTKNVKPKLKIKTINIGKRFMEKRAEKKSAPKKYDQLPELRTRHQIARAA